jgi:hypothetical protein
VEDAARLQLQRALEQAHVGLLAADEGVAH